MNPTENQSELFCHFEWTFHHQCVTLVGNLHREFVDPLNSNMVCFFILQSRAKQLYNAGYKTLTHLANADPAVLSKTIENLYKKQANQIVASAKVGVVFTCPV